MDGPGLEELGAVPLLFLEFDQLGLDAVGLRRHHGAGKVWWNPKHGIAAPRQELELIRDRLKRAEGRYTVKNKEV
jgi:hypothetical protein